MNEPPVLTFGDLALTQGALALLLWDGGHQYAAFCLGSLGAANFLFSVVVVLRGKLDES